LFINATLLGQIITFAIFVWFCMKFIWPKLMKAINDRQALISHGLAAADESEAALKTAQLEAARLLQQAKTDANNLIDKASKQGQNIIDAAKADASLEAQKQFELAKAQITLEEERVKRELYQDVSKLSIAMAQKVLAREIKAADHEALIKQSLEEIRTR
jgi:F-type H+-transporting ATPase subunit b